MKLRDALDASAKVRNDPFVSLQSGEAWSPTTYKVFLSGIWYAEHTSVDGVDISCDCAETLNQVIRYAHQLCHFPDDVLESDDWTPRL
jgi:hypothetical protein